MTLPRVRVALLESETIAGRGRKKVTHLVRYRDAWLPAAEHPGAVVERLSPGPGTVWERRLELELEVGTRVCRVESGPRPEAARDALDYLTDEARGPRRRVERRELRVDARGALVEAGASARAPKRRSR